MKMVAGLIMGLFVSLQAGFGAESVSTVPFVLGPQHFAGGDKVVIEKVTASSPEFAVGDTVTVRGRFVLSSRDKAQLCLYVTTSENVGPEPTLSTQRMEAVKGSGTFELTAVVKHRGHLHLSFYPTPSGNRLGTIYFGTKEQMKEISNWKVSD